MSELELHGEISREEKERCRILQIVWYHLCAFAVEIQSYAEEWGTPTVVSKVGGCNISLKILKITANRASVEI